MPTVQTTKSVNVQTRFQRPDFERIEELQTRYQLKTAAQAVELATKLGLEVLDQLPGNIHNVSSKLIAFLANS